MNIKILCGCGTKYSFDVEPQNGRMPFRVNCPSCNADGTEAANAHVARSLAEIPPADPVLETPPAPPEPQEPPPPIKRASATRRRLAAEERQTRVAGRIVAAVVLLTVAVLGAWFWYVYFGSKPVLAQSIKLPEASSGWRMLVLDGGRIFAASADRALLRDFHTGKELWSTPLPGEADAGGAPPRIFANNHDLWLCAAGQVLSLDQKTGQVEKAIPFAGELTSAMPTVFGLMVVTATDETRREVLRIDASTGTVSTQEIEVPRAEKHAMPDELPPNVQPTAGLLLAQATEEQKFNKPLDAISSEFFSAGENLVELRVKLLEPKVEWIQSIKPKGPSVINGQLTASSSAGAVEEEVFNDMKRDRTGGVKAIDQSTYQIRLRRWVTDKPSEWKGQVSGLPAFFSLPTVDLLTAGKELIVFDKTNNPLFTAPLSYPVNDIFVTNRIDGLAPAVEGPGVLYFFDQGMLTAFKLPGGEVQWRLTSIGIKGVQFDSQGMLYVDSTAASPEEIQYSDQFRLDATPPVIMKVDPRAGKILWQVQKLGQRTALSGKFVYTYSVNLGGAGMLVGLADAVNAPRPEAPTYFHIHLLDPATGKEQWDFYREKAPNDFDFQQNWFVVRFGSDVEAWKFLSF